MRQVSISLPVRVTVSGIFFLCVVFGGTKVGASVLFVGDKQGLGYFLSCPGVLAYKPIYWARQQPPKKFLRLLRLVDLVILPIGGASQLLRLIPGSLFVDLTQNRSYSFNLDRAREYQLWSKNTSKSLLSLDGKLITVHSTESSPISLGAPYKWNVLTRLYLDKGKHTISLDNTERGSFVLVPQSNWHYLDSLRAKQKTGKVGYYALESFPHGTLQKIPGKSGEYTAALFLQKRPIKTFLPSVNLMDFFRVPAGRALRFGGIVIQRFIGRGIKASAEFSGNAKIDEYYRQELLPETPNGTKTLLDLQESPFIFMEGLVQDPGVQCFEIIVTLDQHGSDGSSTIGQFPRRQEKLRLVWTPTKENSIRIWPLLQVAQAKFPGRNTYKVSKIELFYHKKWGVAIPHSKRRVYDFWLRQFYAGDVRRSGLYKKGSRYMKLSPSGRFFIPGIGYSQRWVTTNSHRIPLSSQKPLGPLGIVISYSGKLDDMVKIHASLLVRGQGSLRDHLIACQTMSRHVRKGKILLELLPQSELPASSVITAIFIRTSSKRPLTLHGLHTLTQVDSQTFRHTVDVLATQAGYTHLKWRENPDSIFLMAMARHLDLGLYARVVGDYEFANTAFFVLPHSEDQLASVCSYHIQDIDPTKYRVTGMFPRSGFFLTFSERFDPKWQLSYCRKPTESDKEKCQKISSDNHFIADGYANSWWVPQNTLSSGTAENTSEGYFIISYKFQEAFGVVRIISWVGIIAIVLALLCLFFRRCMLKLSRASRRKNESGE